MSLRGQPPCPRREGLGAQICYFQQSRDHGLEPASLDQIAREWAPRLGLKESEVHSYLTENIYYYLDPPCLEGLQLFYRYAAEIGALPAAPDISFLAANAAVV